MKTLHIKEETEMVKIITSCSVCYVGMIDTEAGEPYVIPMNFAFKDGAIYLHSGQEGKKLSLLEKNNAVCVTFCTGDKLIFQHPDVACSYSMVSQSVVCRGRVVFIDDFDQKVEILNTMMKHYTDRTFSYSTPAINGVKVWRVDVSEMTCKSFGNSIKKQV